MKGSLTPSSASRRAMLVCVNAPGLKISEADAVRPAVWIRPMSSCFGVALEGHELVAQFPGQLRRALLDRVQRVRSVDFGLPRARAGSDSVRLREASAPCEFVNRLWAPPLCLRGRFGTPWKVGAALKSGECNPIRVDWDTSGCYLRETP